METPAAGSTLRGKRRGKWDMNAGCMAKMKRLRWKVYQLCFLKGPPKKSTVWMGVLQYVGVPPCCLGVANTNAIAFVCDVVGVCGICSNDQSDIRQCAFFAPYITVLILNVHLTCLLPQELNDLRKGINTYL
jgi:hypothetical protein